MILLFMVIPGSENLIDDVSVIGHEDESFTGFIQSTNGEDAGGISDEINDVILLHLAIRSANNANGLMESHIDRFFTGFGDELAHHLHFISREDFSAHLRLFPVDGDLPFIYEIISCPAGAIANLAEEFVYTGAVIFAHE